MNVRRQLVVFAVALALLFAVSCAQKPPQLASQAKAPAEVIPSPLPAEISELTPPPPPPLPEPAQVTPPPEQPKPKQAQHHRRKPAQSAVTAQNSAAASTPGPGATDNSASNSNAGTTTMAAAHPPGNPASEKPPDTAIAAEVTSAQLSQQKQTTAQLLDETEKTLSGLGRPLSHDEESIVSQIRSYVAQSTAATKDGDFERAYNLATKAHLLSAALVKK
jgi:hypothetical protein